MATKNASTEILLDGAQMSIASMMAAIAGFLKEKGIPLKEFVNYFGKQFEGAWADLEGRGVNEVMDHFLDLEVLPMGAEVISKQASLEKAEVTLTSLPPRKVLERFGTTPSELLKGFGVTERQFASIYDSFIPAAKAIGLKFSHHAQDGHEVLVLEKARQR
ncbi:hypothetical protein [Dehalogenimonas etheniformans]|uniref:Uncharacterized protein n=1 Tax=Dehalogenimonas etheniformans TaxID=1536648 RepID=A0A2P5P797_9CHLR|nr:hypothetical protein [Dehalogenimonas etheniformans]PPD58164.1 hypothetical protein JP09_005070 [Dehalogenimonas etheniformans]QNT75573.1 hypothetical protein HX448_02165 [Dehalogenimonas etheniformans]